MSAREREFWNVVEARDASITRMREELARYEAGLQEKEAAIQSLHAAAEALRKQLQEKEALILSLHRGAADVPALLRELAEKNDVIETLQSAHRLVLKSLEEKEAAYRQLQAATTSPQVHTLMVKGLEEKEAVIQELSRALEAYRRAFSILGIIVRPLVRLMAAMRFMTDPLRHLLVPRLGILNQHAPRELRLPAHYSKPIAIEPPAPRISIVTPSFRHAAFIERTIRSVLDQGYPNLEYRVQDGASGDGTVEILERYQARLGGWESIPDGGQSVAINRGFARTGGEIMAWLNSDDLLLPGALAYVANYFTEHPEIDVVYGHRICIDEQDRQIGQWILPAHDGSVLSWADYVPQETLFWRRRIWEKAGGKVDESFRFAMDWDLLVRFREAGARFARLPRFIGAFRIHATQKTSAGISEIGFREMDRIRERIHGRVPSRVEVSKAVLPYLIRHAAVDFGWRVGSKLGIAS
jgi:GT2 family glycosyltransferase